MNCGLKMTEKWNNPRGICRFKMKKNSRLGAMGIQLMTIAAALKCSIPHVAALNSFFFNVSLSRHCLKLLTHCEDHIFIFRNNIYSVGIFRTASPGFCG